MKRRNVLKAFVAAPFVVDAIAPVVRIRRVRRPGIDYAKVGETPGYDRQHVIDCNTGLEVEDVVEVDCVDGWALCLSVPEGWRSCYPGELRPRVVIRGDFHLEPEVVS